MTTSEHGARTLRPLAALLLAMVLAGCDNGMSISEIEAKEQAAWSEMSLDEHMDVYLSQGVDKKEAMRCVAKDRGVSKRDIYQALLKE